MDKIEAPFGRCYYCGEPIETYDDFVTCYICGEGLHKNCPCPDCFNKEDEDDGE